MSLTTRPIPTSSLWQSSAEAFRHQPLAFLHNIMQTQRDLAWLCLPEPVMLVIHPAYVRAVLLESTTTYHKAKNSLLGQRVFGDGLITSNGDHWKRQRKLMRPAFQQRQAAQWHPVMVRATQTMLARWEPLAQRRQVVDVAAEMQHLTLAILCRALFGVEVHDTSAEIGQALTTLLTASHQPTRICAVETATQVLDTVVAHLIAARRAESGRQADVLALLLQAQDEDGMFMTDQLVRDELMTLLIAGHETTAVALSWAWYLLSAHADVERRLHEELDRVLSGRVPTVNDLSTLPYTRLVLEETLRLYPPVWATSRVAMQESRLGPYTIPAGTTLLLSPYLTHRHPACWERPEAFDPERFTPERSAGRPRFASFPFGGGPRQCIGERFAMLEAQLVLATVAQRYRLRVVPGQVVEPEPLMSLRVRGGLPMLLEWLA